MTSHGTFVWNELMTPEIEKAKAFYAATLGWSYKSVPMPDGAYTLAFAPGKEAPVAGLFPWPADAPGTRDWFAYIAVDDIAQALERTTAAGGLVLRAPFKVPGTGDVAIVKDAADSVIGFLQPEPM
ncbi:VOC family protein [Oryzibacter oryziterrae]|uniref:VOC family protein n=1 Tax=Oryzibacter oryziterrae TaxID=2766474 RepID=UPI001F3C5EC2|nr:VOC family protein [Oryzibacter oryziterrae]